MFPADADGLLQHVHHTCVGYGGTPALTYIRTLEKMTDASVSSSRSKTLEIEML